MSSTGITIAVIVVVALAAIAVAGYQLARRKRTERLRAQYGPEYERVLHRSDNQHAAESELRDREKRQKGLDLRALDQREREEFGRRWTEVQGEFVDDPGRAVRDADRLVVDVMSARGYPVDHFDQRADDLSVRHPRVTQGYREARRIAQANEDGSADTEELRHAVTSYRELVRALLTDDAGTSPNPDGPGRADGPGSADGPGRDRVRTGREDMGRGERDLEHESVRTNHRKREPEDER